MHIVFVSAEVAPFSKTGGLADVAGALPAALARRGHRVMVATPRYRPADGEAALPHRLHFHLFDAEHEVGLYRVDRDGVAVILIDHPSFRRPGIYGDAHGPYHDNLFRFALMSRAAIEVAALFDDPAQPVVFHPNDWHAGLLPVFLDAHYRSASRHTRSAVVLGLHNLGHQGTTDPAAFAGLHLDGRFFGTCEMDGRLNPLKAGIVSADALVAVSPTYSREICGDHGFGLQSVLQMRSADLVGILNGVDPAWDPRTDPHLAATYDPDELSGKAECKGALQRELGLPVRSDVPLLALISRLDGQKGIDLVEEIAPWLLEQDVQLVMLGSGATRFEQFFRACEGLWPDRARGWVGFNEPLAHRIEAGADIFLMPSRFEPCGLNQMYSMRYGTVPVVHATGGLVDTVTTVDPAHDHGTGWAFRPLSADAFSRAVGFALRTYRQYPAEWRRIQRRGMTTDFSWDRSAARYEAVYHKVLTTRP